MHHLYQLPQSMCAVGNSSYGLISNHSKSLCFPDTQKCFQQQPPQASGFIDVRQKYPAETNCSQIGEGMRCMQIRVKQ